MLELSSRLGEMGVGVSHGGSGGSGGGSDSASSSCRLRAQSQGSAGGNGDSAGSGCRLRAQNQGQAAQGSPSQKRGSNNSGQIQARQPQQVQQRHGLTGRSKKDNCCLCWCCCCSCSNKCLAAVGTGGSGGATSMRPGAGGLRSGEHGADAGLLDDLTGEGLGNGLESEIANVDIEEIRAWGESFDRLMRSSVGRRLFREFCVSEYSDENIAFWLACEQLKHEKNPEKIEEKARCIYEGYISIISPKEVSLDSRVRDIVNRNMTQPTPHTFDEAQLQIYTLMHRDSYPRFINSDIYQRVARLGVNPPSPCSAPQDGAPSTAPPATAASSATQTRKSKKSIT